MSILQSVYASLQQEGYRPQLGDDSRLWFKYYGQSATFRTRLLGTVLLAELECVLPCAVPDDASMQAFLTGHPLCRLSVREHRLVLTLETMLIERELASQLRSLMRLLDQYSADLVWNQDSGPAQRPEHAEHEPQPITVEQSAPTAPAVDEPAQAAASHDDGPGANTRTSSVPPLDPADTASPEGRPRQDGTSSAESRPGPAPADPDRVPHGWEEVWPLLNSRYHALGRALYQLGAPVPHEVHMDMLQGHQVRGSAIMMWGSPPDAVVLCEQGQVIPAGYQGGTWYKHQTAEQVAEETVAYLRAARYL